MTENALVPAPTSAVAVSDQDFKDLAAGSDFLAPIRLMQPTSDPVKDGKVEMGSFVLFKVPDKPDNLGKNFRCHVIAWRPKAVLIENRELQVITYQKESREFQTIKEEASKQRDPNSTTMNAYGPEFLVYLPDLGVFAALFCNTPTLRITAPDIHRMIGKAATITSHLIRKKTRSWFGLQVSACGSEFPLPPEAEYQDQWQRFLNPQTSAKELAPEEESDRER